MSLKMATKFDIAEYLDGDSMIAEYLKKVILKISLLRLDTLQKHAEWPK